MNARTIAVFAASPWLASMVFASGIPNMSCTFDTFIRVQYDNLSDTTRTPIHQMMTVVTGKTDVFTQKLDGKYRATNSVSWQVLELANRETWESTFVGDFRDVLTLAHELGANRLPLHGSYKASLAYTGVDESHISLGRCVVN